MNGALPANINLLTLEPWDAEGRLLVRLEHVYAIGEDDTYSKPVTVSLKVFSIVQIGWVESMKKGNYFLFLGTVCNDCY